MRRIYAMALCLVLLFSAAVFVRSIGSESDPVVSLSYARDVWLPQQLEETAILAGSRLTPVYNQALESLARKVAVSGRDAELARTGIRRGFGKLVLKQGDLLLPQAGCKITLFSGTISANETLVNVTAGQNAAGTLAARTLYMQSDTASPGLSVTSAAAEVLINGNYTLKASREVDYGSLAEALSAMGLFRGMTTGYELLGGTTRAQGLVMFLRLMGKEAEALACTDPVPFADVPATHWAHPYVAYAYKNGLTTGVTQTAFQPDAAVTAQHYLTFLLRALQYAEGDQFSYATVLVDTVTLGLMSQQEITAMSQGPFLRHKMVYLSYYALFCPDGKTGTLLLESLISSGTVTDAGAAAGMAAVKGWRME